MAEGQAPAGQNQGPQGVPKVSDFPQLFNPAQYQQQQAQQNIPGLASWRNPDGTLKSGSESDRSGGGGSGGGLIGYSGLPQGALTSSLGPYRQRQVDRTRAAHETELLRQSVIAASRANRGPAVYGPTPQAYRDAMAQQVATLNQGLQMSAGSINSGVGALYKGQSDAINALNENYGLAIDRANELYGEAQALAAENYATGEADLRAAGIQAREDLIGQAEEAIAYHDPISSIADESIQAYRDRVLGDFGESFAEYQASPAYQFGLQEGLKSIQSSAAARGMLGSGATLKALQERGSDYASQQFNDYYNTRVNQARELAQLGATGLLGQADLANQLGVNLAGVGTQSARDISGYLAEEAQYRGGLYGDQVGQLGTLYSNLANQSKDVYQTTGQGVGGLYGQLAGIQSDVTGRMAQAQQQGILGAGSAFQRAGQGGGVNIGGITNF